MDGSSGRDKLHSIESAAEFLGGISPWAIRTWLYLGKLRRVGIGRRTFVYESDLAACIKPENRGRISPVSLSARRTGRQTPPHPSERPDEMTASQSTNARKACESSPDIARHGRYHPHRSTILKGLLSDAPNPPLVGQ